MLSIFSVPKRFEGHIDVIHRNAIRSWMLLKPTCEIILCGDEPGIKEITEECDLIHIPDIEKYE